MVNSRFVGKMVGVALRESVLLQNISFASFFLCHWKGQNAVMEDLKILDEDLHKNLMFLKNFDGDFEDLSLTFSCSQTGKQQAKIIVMGECRTIDLKPQGRFQAVTRENKLEYILMMSFWKLNVENRVATQSFLSGLYEEIPSALFGLFSLAELEQLVAGDYSPLDLEDWKRNTVYASGLNALDPLVQMFWQIVAEMSDEEQRKLMRFVTSCWCPPLQGFSAMNPRFTIGLDAGFEAEMNQTRLPTASTCLNMIKLPLFHSKEEMMSKLKQAIQECEGFHLS